MLTSILYRLYERRLLADIRRHSLPRHIGLILDGNRRFARQLGLADIIQGHLEANGMEIITGCDVAEFVGNGDLKALKLDNGKAIGCEVVVVGKGVVPPLSKEISW